MRETREMIDLSHFASAAIMQRTALRSTKLQAVQADRWSLHSGDSRFYRLREPDSS